jgi:hypothetical protein
MKGELPPIMRVHSADLDPIGFARARLNNLADVVLGIPFGAKGALAKRQRPLRELGLSDAQRSEIASILRNLARTPAALEHMSGRRKGPGSPPDRAKAVRDYSMVLDYQEQRKQRKREKAAVVQELVSSTWGVRRTALTDANQKLVNSKHWKAWAKLVRRHVKSKHKSAKDLPRKTSLFLRNPANLRELPGHDRTGRI